MKKYLSFFILLFIARSYSQEYVPLLQEGNKWYEYHEYYPDGLGEISLTSIFIDGEETINGIVYKKLISNLYSKCLSRYAYPTGCYPTGNSDEFYKLLRENINERKVYFYDEILNADVLLYDFSLNIGDLLPLNFPFRANNSSYNSDSMIPITKIVKNGKVFNQIIPNTYFTQEVFNNNYEWNDKIHEGIGSNTGLLYIPGKPIFEGGNLLICFENTLTGKSCDALFLSTNENLQKSPISLIYLKDKKAYRVIGKSSENFKIEFYDFNGRLLETKDAQFNEDFYLNNISKSGVFLYKITYQDNLFNGKILIP